MLSGTWETDQLGYCYVIIIMITLKKESKGLEYHGGRPPSAFTRLSPLGHGTCQLDPGEFLV